MGFESGKSESPSYFQDARPTAAHERKAFFTKKRISNLGHMVLIAFILDLPEINQAFFSYSGI